jgi:DNA primase large subunit
MAVRRTPALDDRSLYAEYPFLPGAEALLGAEAVSVRSLLEDPAYARARAIGRARILAAADDPRGTRDLDELVGAAPEVRFLSFLYARLLLSAGPSPATLRRWAVSEAKRSHGRLARVDADELGEVARRLGVEMEPSGAGVEIPLVEYLHLATPIREGDYRLASQEVIRGHVRVGRVRAARLLQEAVRIRLTTPVPVAEDVVARVRERESELFLELQRRSPAPVARGGGPSPRLHPEWFPPCIRKMQRTLTAGENLSHAGRFALSAFLHRVGADFETIVDAYRGAPDFDEAITRYQVEHITHHGGGEGYSVPECDTLRSHGLCFREGDPEAPDAPDRLRDARCFDPKLRHPLQYYRWRGGTEVVRGEEGVTPGAAPGSPAPPGRSRSTARR